MRNLVVIALLVLSTGCGRAAETRSGTNSSSSSANSPVTIGPQFWKFDLDKEYAVVADDVVYGLGGRWISVRYQRRSGETTTREEIVSRIAGALEADGWKTKPLPGGKYVLSEMWETSPADLHFTRLAKSDEPQHWFFEQTVFVSADASIVALYCEVGW